MGKVDATSLTTSGSLLNRYAHECRKTMNIKLHIQPMMNAITIDVFDATPARLAFFSPRRLPIRTDVAMPSANGAWKVEFAETRSMD